MHHHREGNQARHLALIPSLLARPCGDYRQEAGVTEVAFTATGVATSIEIVLGSSWGRAAGRLEPKIQGAFILRIKN